MKIKATIEVNAPDRGGKPIASLWRATLATELKQESCKVQLLGKVRLEPKQKCDAEIIITGRDAPKLKEGLTFDLHEGLVAVATGRVNKVIN